MISVDRFGRVEWAGCQEFLGGLELSFFLTALS